MLHGRMETTDRRIARRWARSKDYERAWVVCIPGSKPRRYYLSGAIIATTGAEAWDYGVEDGLWVTTYGMDERGDRVVIESVPIDEWFAAHGRSDADAA